MPNIETPPQLRGTPEQQLSQLHSYLYRLAENLNVSLSDTQTKEVSTTGQTQSPKAIFEAIRTLIANSKEILDVYYIEIFNRLESVFVSLTEYQEDITGINEELEQIGTALAKIKDSVTETSASSAGGISWNTRRWESGAVEMWGSGSMALTADTAVSIVLPVSVSGAAFVSLGSGYAQGVKIAGGNVIFTPSISGSTINVYVYVRSI